MGRCPKLIEAALSLLSSFDDVESDVAFELGMSALRKAVCASATSEQLPGNEVAHKLASTVRCIEGARPDAIAFGTACTAVARSWAATRYLRRMFRVSTLQRASGFWDISERCRIGADRRAETAGRLGSAST